MVALTLSPWHGKNLPTVSGEAYRYELRVAGRANERLTLSAQGLPNGWIAAFCTERVCMPMQARLTLPADGRERLEFGLIQENARPVRTMRITIQGSDGSTTRIVIRPQQTPHP
ncbi:MAG: hypothetical protein HKL92_08580 [Candidatus Eremiobacteraeota bacterium]|nr:hypothetical protein [Candidatus Eremiobacteraeota bacterium]